MDTSSNSTGIFTKQTVGPEFYFCADGVGLAFRPRWHGGWTYVKHRQNRYRNGFEFYWRLHVATVGPLRHRSSSMYPRKPYRTYSRSRARK